ncbi:hypothetical protein CLIB1444_08S02916 [[Candida] jaroonii]|uniref:Uncharacterized protein n=1 Tax=[Candida] jaroonii TaxID=467808 RepID=A0ACA9YAP9_9ASCO|nr:hypothetical protein CLIB1444_08S02916 [[Candida] jaroonii]
MKKGFKTDSDISNRQFQERELERWVPEDNGKELTLDNDGGDWDQFQANKDKFGIESTYDEHLYTTRINTEAKDYQERLKKAEQVAFEIEHSITSDPHIMEERGKIDDSGIDEEDKYSGVQREEKDTRGDELMAALKSVNLDKKYIPSKSKNSGHNDPAIVSSKLPSKPTESFRLNAQSEINSLKEFSATFKVPHKIPNDLLPILSKDKSKQDEIVKKTEVKKDEPKKDDGKKKMDPKKPAFNPNAVSFNPNVNSFTPSAPTSSGNNSYNKNYTKPKSFSQPGQNQHHSNQNQNQNHRDYKNNSPRLSQSRPYSNKRHYQISPQEFFGGSSKIPTKESQIEKIKNFKTSFNMFIDRETVEKAFITPPTWDLTVDESYSELMPPPETANPMMGGMMNNQMMPMGYNPMMGGMMNGVNPMMMPMQNGMAMQPMQMQMPGMPVQMPMQFMPMFPQSPVRYSPNYSPYNSPQPISAQTDDDEYYKYQGQPNHRRYSKR